MITTDAEIAASVQAVREYHAHTQRHLLGAMEALGVTMPHSSYSYAERGHRAFLARELLAIAQVYDLTVYELLTYAAQQAEKAATEARRADEAEAERLRAALAEVENRLARPHAQLTLAGAR